MAEELRERMLDPKTPDEVEVTDTPREPVEDPTLGILVDNEAEGRPRNRLVTIGDSLTHGFQSGAIYNTDISWPAIVARELGWQKSFRYPNYFGYGGLPLNVEFLIRGLEERLGDTTRLWESPLALFRARQFMDDAEDYWERGAGSTVPKIKEINHNLAVYGWDLRDALVTTSEMLEAKILEPTDHFFKQIIENANERAALRVMKSAQGDNGRSLTAFGAAARLGEEGTQENPGQGEGIETLIVLLGANNALPSMLSLEVIWSGDGYDDVDLKEQFTVWNPVHFKAELDLMVEEIKKIRARHVILGTVPHVTIAPIARGVGPKVRKGSRYYPFYTRPWISTEDFDVGRDPYVTEQEARAIDSAIDQYNDAIAEAVEAARNDGLDWYRQALHRRPAGQASMVAQVRASTGARNTLPRARLTFLRRRTGGADAGRPLLARRGASDHHRIRDTRPGVDRRDAATRGRTVLSRRRRDQAHRSREGGFRAPGVQRHPDLRPPALPYLRSEADRLGR